MKYIRLDHENKNASVPLSEEQIIAILKENNIISDNEDDKNIILVTSFEALNAFDKIFDYLK
ncbi:5763_t:CDS:2 [Funneliformis geosporum]|uniref:5763_t:CDS:1 n=1 Tax=Funneliformis geosporum TaxID=1117311 RepID=A0A9W4SWM8_9GLOM|nr:5763_t:CDS:2 [Funneliformis geosporum]